MKNNSYLRFGVLACIISGVLLSLAFPFWACGFSQVGKTGFGVLAWVALVPVMLFTLNARRMRHVVLAGILTGTVNHFLLLYWLMGTMHNYGYMSWPLSFALLLTVAIITSGFMVLALVLMRLCTKTPVLFFIGAACVWVLVEYFRTYAFTGLPWALLGYTQFTQLKLIQIVDISGVYGLSFILALVNAALAVLLNSLYQAQNLRKKYALKGVACLAAALVLTAAAVIYGQARYKEIAGQMAAAPTANIGLVQASVPQDEKWEPAFQNATLNDYAKFSLEAAQNRPDVILWPETALPFYFPQDEEMSPKVFNLVNRLNTPLYTGAPRYVVKSGGASQAYSYLFYNSAFLLVPGQGLSGVYDKVHLVPFGEYVPWQSVLFFMGKLTGAGDGFEKGTAGRVISSANMLNGNLKLGTLICYEGIFADLARVMAQNGANLMVNITNDAWYDYSAGPYQHFIISMFRGVETRRAFVRCANTGISAYVLPTGQITYQTALFQKVGVSREMPLMQTETFYTRHGDIFAKSICVLALILVIGGGLSKCRKYKEPL